ncbi:MAG: hypothetical protein R2844_03140 [Caldilineales bacterium]
MKRKQILGTLAVSWLLAISVSQAGAQSGGGWTVTWSTTQGGGVSSAGGYVLRGSAGQATAGTASGGGFTLGSGFWQSGPQAPLAVTLASFTAQQDGASILVAWETVSEIDCAGFNLYRGFNDDWSGANLQAFVPSQAPGSAQGFVYDYRDADVEPGPTYRYWLEDVDLSGQGAQHGPVTVTLADPTAVTLAELTANAGAVLALPELMLATALLLALAAALTASRELKRG